ncbi:MAG: winged-helix domain-containing protein [Nitrososphaerales archaeon]
MGTDFPELDQVDKIILEMLNTNARMPSKEIANKIKSKGMDITDRAVRKRIERLEKKGVIRGYTAILAEEKLVDRFNLILLRFKPAKDFSSALERVKEYAKNMPTCVFVAGLSGEWHVAVLLSHESGASLRSESRFIEKFADDISDFRICDFKPEHLNSLYLPILFMSTEG